MTRQKSLTTVSGLVRRTATRARIIAIVALVSPASPASTSGAPGGRASGTLHARRGFLDSGGTVHDQTERAGAGHRPRRGRGRASAPVPADGLPGPVGRPLLLSRGLHLRLPDGDPRLPGAAGRVRPA